MNTFELKIILSAVLFMCCWQTSGNAGIVSSLDDIEYWSGSGVNRAGLVVDWDGKSSSDESLAWGFRWDGTATAEDLLRAVLSTDQRLYSKFTSLAGYSSIIVNGMGYDDNDDCLFALSDGTTFNASGIHSGAPSDLATSVDPNDLYAEGWFFYATIGSWHIGTSAANPFDGGAWSSASAGISDLNLANNSWISLAFTTNLADFAENPIAAELPGPTGDFDLNDDVDGADFLTWQRGFGILSDASRTQGDADCNGMVDTNDRHLWEENFGLTASATTTNFAAMTVPEPHGAFLLLGMSLLLISRRYQRL